MNAITMPQNSPSEKPVSAPSSPPILAAALEYSAYGWPVFPCAAATKAPLTPHGFRDASTDPARIHKWWARWPDAMIGLPTGAASGVIVVDLDVDDGKGLNGIAEIERLEAVHGRLPDGPAATTPRGGAHLFFRHDPNRPLRCSTGKIAPGIDVRADGGFVVLAPSFRADGAVYAWIAPPFADLDFPDLPTWLHDLAAPKPAPAPAAPVARHQPVILDPRRRAYALAALHREAEAVATAPEGGRNARLNEAAHAIGNFVGAGVLDEGVVIEALTTAAREAGLVGSEIMKTTRSGLIAGARKEPRWPTEWTDDADAVAINAHLVGGVDGAPHPPAPGGASWEAPDLSILAESRRAPPKFDPEWLGPHLARWAEAQARATCAPIDYVSVSLLALVGGLLGNRRRPVAGAGWEETPALWATLVGDPSSGKSPASSAVMSLVNAEEASLDADYRQRLREYETEKLAADAIMAVHKSAAREAMRSSPELAAAIPVALPEGFRDPVKPFLKRIVVRDSTVERLATLSAENPGGLILHRDELAGLFASFGQYRSGGGGSDRQFYLEAYGGRNFTVDRVKTGDPIRVPHLSIGIIGALQPDKAAELLRGADDGFVSRFLWAWPDPAPGFRIAREAFDQGPAERVVNRICRLHMRSNVPPLPDSPVLLPLEEPALAVLELFAQKTKARESSASSLMKSALGKARGHAMRLSCVLTHLWWSADPQAPWEEPANIGEAAVTTACEMMTGYFLHMAARVFGDASIPVAETNATTLAHYLREKRLPTFNARAVGRELGGPLRTAAEMDAACEELVEAGLISPIGALKAGRGRKPKDFRINPAMLRP